MKAVKINVTHREAQASPALRPSTADFDGLMNRKCTFQAADEVAKYMLSFGSSPVLQSGRPVSRSVVVYFAGQDKSE